MRRKIEYKPLTEEQRLMVEKNMPLALWFTGRWIRRFPAHFADHEDARQLAYLGLVKAASTFNEAQGKFATWACMKMLGEFCWATQRHRSFADCGHAIWTSHSKLFYTVIGTLPWWDERHCGLAYGPTPSKADGVSEPAAEDPTTLEDADYAEAALSRMRPRASAYIRRIANGETLVDIAAAEGRSPQRIRQVVTAAREKIRSQMQAA